MNQQTTRPQSAIEILRTAASTLGERGKQYDPNGKQERSMTAIVQAFNAIYPRSPLTVHMGWQFMSLVKMVRGATKPHADSALDQVAYAALAAECVAEALHQPESTKGRDQAVHYYVVLKDPALAAAQANFIMDKIAEGEIVQLTPEDVIRQREEVGEEEPAENTTQFFGQMTTADITSTRTVTLSMPTEAGYARVPVKPKRETPNSTPASHTIAQVAELERTNQELAEELGKCQHWAGVQSQELKHLTDKLAAQQELLSVAQHNANFYFDKTNSCIAANESMTAKFQAERKANVAMHEEVTRLRNKVQELTDLAEYRDKRNAELCAELETQRGKCIAQSSRISELQTLVDNLRSSLAQATKEAPCAHNTDEPKAPRPEYVDPYDSHGGQQPAPVHRLVGDRDPARGGLAYPQGKPL